MTTTPQPTETPFKIDLAFCLSPDSSRDSSIRIVEPKPEDPYANRGNLYILIELLNGGPGQATLLRQLLNTVQQIYYTAKGSQSSVLTQAINAANSLLQQANLKNRQAEVRAGITCVTLLRDQLTLAVVGPSLTILANSQSVEYLTPDAQEFSPPLGGIELPEIEFARHTVRPQDVIFLAESEWLMRMPLDRLAGTLSATEQSNLFEVVDYLRGEVSPAELLGLVAVLSAPPAPTPRSTISPAVPSTRSRPTPSRTGLPSAVGASPPVRDVPPAPQPSQRPIPRPTAGSRSAQAARQPGDQPPAPSGPAPSDPPRQIPRRNLTPPAPPSSTPPEDQARESTGPSIFNQGARWLSGLWAGMLPDRSGAARPRQARDRFIPARGERAAPAQSAAIATETAAATPTTPRPAPGPSPIAVASEAVAEFQPPAPAKGGRARIFVSLSVLILVLTIIGVATIYLRGATNRADAEQLVALAETNLIQAKGMVDLGEDAGARNLLSDAQGFLTQAAQIVGNTQQIAGLNADIEKELQSVLKIFTLYGLDIPLERFANGDPSEVVVSDQDVYILDTGRQVIEHLRLDSQREVVEERTGVILREGDTVGGVVVGRLVDMTWEPRNSGFVDKAGLLILDRNNHVFRYNRVDGASLVVFADQASWQVPTKISVYLNGLFYLVDQGRQQIYKYTPTSRNYEAAPEPWLSDQITTDFAGLKTMRIDGDIWLLYENGMVLQYFRGEQNPFALENNVGRMEDPRDMIVDGTHLYLADAAGARILVYNKDNGSYERQYQAADVDLLRGLRSIYVDETTGKIFLLTQTGLYQQTLPR